ncbi:MAG: phosphatidate cytidylyltransferase [Vicinamibacterales bacterium]
MTRLVSGVVLAAAALAAIWFLPLFALRVIACLVAALAAHEYLRVASGSAPLPVMGLVALNCWVVSSPGDGMVVLLLALGWVAVEVLWGNVPIQQAAARFLAPWYIGMPLGMLVAVHGAAGEWATLVLIGTVVVSDSAQYYTGRAFGRRPLAPAISPKKTIEGAIGGLLFGTLFLAIAGPWALGAGVVPMALLGLAVATLGICGDLFESRLKRASGVKDSSSLIPGHGGVLDRIDALLFAIPAFYLFLRGTP